MEVFVRGARSSSRDWSAAHSVPFDELPQLNDEQRAEARRLNLSDEAFARTLYAQKLTRQATLDRLTKFGRWLNARIADRNPESSIHSIELDTWSGKLHIQGMTGVEQFILDLDEDLVERFLLTGAADLERSIDRVLDIFLPDLKIARAS